jgi:hypothetical protein
MRLFYIALGATAGVLVVRRITRAAQQFTPEGVARNVSGASNRFSDAIAGFVEDVRVGMVEREGELRSALGIDAGGSSV